ncbi:MAG: hypothetical protein R3285_01830 [Kiloniellales bacterium]|nr:hypothetical protein [Kiloniellales bacterium]
MVDFKLLAKVISVLGEVPRGGEDMDIRISVALGEMQSGSAKLLRLFVEEGYDWGVISSLLDEQVPPYTTSLDAGVPGENIVGVLFSRKRGRWAAIHRGSDGREEGPVWAASEALARRAAGLAGVLAQARMGRDPQAQPELPDKPPRRSLDVPSDAPADVAAEASADDQAGAGPEAEDDLPDWKILF